MSSKPTTQPSKEMMERAEKMLENEAIFSFPPQVVQADGMTERKELVWRGKWVNRDLIEEIALALTQAKAEGAERVVRAINRAAEDAKDIYPLADVEHVLEAARQSSQEEKPSPAYDGE